MNFFRRHSLKIKWYEHVNPDGTKGGMVADTAIVDDGAYIPVSAIIMPNTHIKRDTKICKGGLVTREGTVTFQP